MSLLKQSLGKAPTLGSITPGCPCWPSPALDRAAWVSTHCSAFCHPFPGFAGGNCKQQQQSKFFFLYFFFFYFPFQPWAGGKGDLGSALRSAAEPGCREGGLVLYFAGAVGADPAAKGILGHVPSSRHCSSLSWRSYFCLNFPAGCLQRFPV